MEYPKMFRVRQGLNQEKVAEIPGTVKKELDAIEMAFAYDGREMRSI